MAIETREIRQRIFVSDLLDKAGELQELKLTTDEAVWNEDGHIERLDEVFELNSEYVTYKTLLARFGKTKMLAFIEDATQNAR